MIVLVMAISNLALARQIYSEETNGAHAHYREPVPAIILSLSLKRISLKTWKDLDYLPTEESVEVDEKQDGMLFLFWLPKAHSRGTRR